MFLRQIRTLKVQMMKKILVVQQEKESQNFLNSILTAARPWSTNGRGESIIKETGSDNKHKMAQTTRGPRVAVVGEPPPSSACPTIVNPYPGPA